MNADVLNELVQGANALAGRVLVQLGQSTPDLDRIREDFLAYAANSEARLAARDARIARLERESQTDSLTGLPNRLGFDAFLSRTLSHARRHGGFGTVVRIDVEEYGLLKSRLGTAVAHKVLRAVAEKLSAQIRAGDMAARLAGGSFGLVLSHATVSTGIERAQQFAQALNRTVISHHGIAVPIWVSHTAHAFDGHTQAFSLLADAGILAATQA